MAKLFIIIYVFFVAIFPVRQVTTIFSKLYCEWRYRDVSENKWKHCINYNIFYAYI